MKVILLKTWITNVGNGFIDKGTRAVIKRAYPGADVIEASGYPNHAADRKSAGPLRGASTIFGGKGERLENVFREKNTNLVNNAVNIGEFVNADFAVLPGLSSTSEQSESFYRHYKRSLERTFQS